MSLPTDIIQLFGTGSVPAIVAGSVLGLFELGERFASQRAKDALSKWLLTFDVQKAKALPDGTQEIFERIFGERHFSWKCFVRSAAFSLGAMAFISILMFLVYPKEFSKLIALLGRPQLPNLDQFPKDFVRYVLGTFFVSWFLWSVLIDYVSLFKTRAVLSILTRMRSRNALVAGAILVIDYIAYILLFSWSFWLFSTTAGFVTLSGFEMFGFESAFYNISAMRAMREYYNGIIPVLLHSMVSDLHHWLIPPRDIQLRSIFFWAGLAPSIWMWLYVTVLFVTRGLLRSEKPVNWLRWALDVEKAPFRSIGVVAATLAFVASLAIIFVSAEVSRISAAS